MQSDASQSVNNLDLIVSEIFNRDRGRDRTIEEEDSFINKHIVSFFANTSVEINTDFPLKNNQGQVQQQQAGGSRGRGVM